MSISLKEKKIKHEQTDEEEQIKHGKNNGQKIYALTQNVHNLSLSLSFSFSEYTFKYKNFYT